MVAVAVVKEPETECPSSDRPVFSQRNMKIKTKMSNRTQWAKIKNKLMKFNVFLLCDSTHYSDNNQPIKEVVYRTNTRNNGDDGIQKRLSNVDTSNY